MCGDGEEIKRLFYMSPTRKGMCGTNCFMLLCSRFYCDMYRLYLKDKAGGGLLGFRTVRFLSASADLLNKPLSLHQDVNEHTFTCLEV